MKNYRLNLKPLTDEAFAPFGNVIQKQGHYPEETNYGQTRKYARLADIDVSDQEGTVAVHIYRSRQISLPFRIEVMEHHPLGSQTFMPLHDRPFLVVVAPPAEKLAFKEIHGFFTNGEQGVNFHKGVWHHHQISLDEISDYLVIDRDGPGNNKIEQHISKALFIEEFM